MMGCAMRLWKRREPSTPEGWSKLIKPTYPLGFPAPETAEEVEGILAGLIFWAQTHEDFPRCGLETFSYAGLPGQGVVIHFDERSQEDEAFRIAISKERIPPGRETPMGRTFR
jgi:hypothetical protein